MDEQEERGTKATKRGPYSSPKRILARAFEMSRDRWKAKHHSVRAELAQTRQLATERGVSRDRWKRDCELAQASAVAAEQLAEERLVELERIRARCVELAGQLAAPKK